MTKNRGKHPNDDKIFGKRWHPALREAVNDMCYLLTRGYGSNSALSLVGNRYQLNNRQRLAVLRISASDHKIENRQLKACQDDELAGQEIDIDGFNLLVLLESALSGAYLFKCRDGTYRDIASVHGSYKRVMKTEAAMELVGKTLQELKVAKTTWWLDAPVSNSGRLKGFLQEIGQKNGYPWEMELVNNPDQALANSKKIVISSDGWILDQVSKWYNLGAFLIEQKLTSEHLIVV